MFACGPVLLSPHVSAATNAYAVEVLSDLPIAYWKLDELSGTAMTDSSGHGRNGLYGGLVALGNPPLITAGKSIKTSTTGTATVATAPNDAALRLPGDFSLEFWIKTGATTGNVLSMEQGGVNYPSWQLGLNSSGCIKLELRTSNGGSIAALIATSAINDNAIHHIVYTKNGSLVTAYVDGAPNATGSFTGPPFSSTDPVSVGCSYAPGYDTSAMIGSLDEVAIYDTALSAARVLTHYTAGIAP
ncbi:LamG domain-containing protein [Glaciimonas sp. PCH181]|uniref:LamG domain-containing protein n=1 Tax=Glaciimonas sp. PCH181 TaxID=2133943 RepID=UPI000D3D2516|nr:LamG domain-containing protein [Glaciimonas sp. PCH181]PUA17253.1 hypothetical protein C7W93_15080 [Glaciimonas sp. PCH181]